MQIIIIESAEALAEQIVKHQSAAHISTRDAVLTCLHPIEVPSDAVELVEMARDVNVEGDGVYSISYRHTPDKIAALITAYSRTVPMAMLQAVGDWILDDYEAQGHKIGEETLNNVITQFGFYTER